MMIKTAQELAYESMEQKWNEKGVKKPLRKDGSAFWVIANMKKNKMFMPKEMQKYSEWRYCYGYIRNESNFGVIYQADTALSASCGITFRTLTENDMLLKFMHVLLSIRDKKELTEYEKLLIAEFAKDGYIMMKQDAMKRDVMQETAAEEKRPVINIPVLTKDEMKKMQKIVDEVKDFLGHDFLKDYIEGFAATMEPLIPTHLDKNLRNYHKYATMGGFDLFAHLVKQAGEGGKCRLKLPDKEEAKYICTLIVLK